MMILDLLINPDERDRKRLAHFLGFFDPKVWAEKPSKKGDWWHGYKNFWAEWSKADPQRSGKLVHDSLALNLLLILIVVLLAVF